MNRIINATNLHQGGGVQSGVSVISEAALDRDKARNLSTYASSEVDANLIELEFDSSVFGQYVVADVRGMGRLPRKLSSGTERTTVFTIFGPLYRWSTPFRSIVGFAQPWIIYPNNECYERLPFVQRLKTRLKFWIQAQFFKRADVLVVELEHVKEGLVRELGYPAERIHVVHNCLSSLYTQPELWQDVQVSPATNELALGFLGRNYMHKNTEIFPEIVATLKRDHGIAARFYVTFTDEEWRACSEEFRKASVNVGPLTVAQCPNFYRSMDAVVFPSLLECFSATPLEAMAMERPLFASDRPFNRDICQNHAHYFDPLSPAAAAAEIAKVFGGEGPNSEALRLARDHAFGFSSAAERARKYLDLLELNA
jgi:glycosyltransferase involved in cell wall biosynthesis